MGTCGHDNITRFKVSCESILKNQIFESAACNKALFFHTKVGFHLQLHSMSSSASSLGPTMHHFGGASLSYSTAFPPLQSFPWKATHTRRSSHHGTSSSSMQHSLAPPKYPTYLKQTLYADLAVEQYNYFQSRRSFFPTERPCSSTSSSHNSSLTSSLVRSHSQSPHSAELDSLDLRLPTCWNQKDKSRFIEIGRNALDLSYTGNKQTQYATSHTLVDLLSHRSRKI